MDVGPNVFFGASRASKLIPKQNFISLECVRVCVYFSSQYVSTTLTSYKKIIYI
jgi:hypothetical protein